MALPVIEECARGVILVFPFSVCKKPKPSSCLWRCFTRINPEKWCFLGLPLSPLLFNSVIEVATEIPLFSCENSGIHICSNRNLSDLEYTDDVVLCSIDPRKLQVFLNRPNGSVSMFGTRFHLRSSKCCFRTRLAQIRPLSWIKWVNLVTRPPYLIWWSYIGWSVLSHTERSINIH